MSKGPIRIIYIDGCGRELEFSHGIDFINSLYKCLLFTQELGVHRWEFENFEVRQKVDGAERVQVVTVDTNSLATSVYFRGDEQPWLYYTRDLLEWDANQ